MGDVRYEMDKRGTAELMRTPEMHGAMELIAIEAVPFARAISPDAPPYGAGYVEKFEVNSTTVNLGRRLGRRAAAELTNTADYATSVELGSFDNPRDTGHHVLARTADHIERG